MQHIALNEVWRWRQKYKDAHLSTLNTQNICNPRARTHIENKRIVFGLLWKTMENPQSERTFRRMRINFSVCLSA